jgi:hypothetical protein
MMESENVNRLDGFDFLDHDVWRSTFEIVTTVGT